MSANTDTAVPVRTNGHHDTAPDRGIDLHLISNGRWAALDLDELLEQLVLAGSPPELICTYQDPAGRRRYVRRRLASRPPRRQEVKT
jgi:hypothetical protein